MRALACTGLLLLAGCPTPAGTPDAGGPADGSFSRPDASTQEDAGTGNETIAAGAELLSRLSGLWSGPATMTPAGDFPRMNVDFRALDDHALFGRVDVDQANGLRFLLLVERIDGKDELIYRNDGYFQGVLRDMRARLVEVDAASARFRFCHLAQGCGYIDALYDFDGDDTLTFDVKVKGAQHVLWKPKRKEERAVPSPFPADLQPRGDGTGPFPPMPSLQATVHWSGALAAPAEVILLLSSGPCAAAGGCEASRTSFVTAPAGATEAQLQLDQLHPGSYRANAVLDRNNNFRAVLSPDSGDGVSFPDAVVEISAAGEAKTLPIVATVP